uniref:Uncharacterized protein n=1 Tax=Rhodnius prolixus TaxID=13249 RepID=T1I4V1_RHOPR
MVHDLNAYPSMAMPHDINVKLYIFSAIGALFCIFGTTIFFTWPEIFTNILHSQMQIIQGSHTFALWRDTPVPMYMNFYFHNWTNPDELKLNKPRFQQMGPYRFKSVIRKVRHKWHTRYIEISGKSI